jgi:MFS family permease
MLAVFRFFSGRFADRTHAYWTITIGGYALNVIAVPLLAYAGNWQMAALLVIVERTGKALRGPARDVLLSEATNVVGHGWGFGLHAAFDQAGAMLGPLLMAFAVARSNLFGPAFLRLGVPAFLALAALATARAPTPPEAFLPLPGDLSRCRKSSGFTWLGRIVGLRLRGFSAARLSLPKTGLAKPAMIPCCIPALWRSTESPR